MSIPFSGTLSRSAGLISAVAKHIKLLNLKAVKRITVTFDPFAENVKSTREFLFHLSISRVSDTNPRCILKTNIVCDRSDPTVVCELIAQVQEKTELNSVKFNAKNLTTLELLQQFNKHVTVLAPKEEESKTVATKSKKKEGRRK